MKIFKNKKMLIATAAVLAAVSGFGAYTMYANAAENVDQEFISVLTVDAAETRELTKEALIAKTHTDKINRVTSVDLKNDEFMKDLKPGIYTVRMDLKLNFKKSVEKVVTISVKDSKAPVIKTVKNEITVPFGSEVDATKFVEADDIVDGKLDKDHIKLEHFNAKKVGTQNVTIVATDRAGNSTTKAIKITVSEDPKVIAEKAAAKKAAAEQAKQAQIAAKKQAAAEKAEQAAAKKAEEAKQAEQAQQVVEESMEEPVVESQATTQQQQAKVQEQAQETNVLQFGGATIPFVDAQGASRAPESNAGIWMGNGLVNDGAPTHFIGHNPGDFSGVMNLYVGDAITVVDASGNSRTYHVYEVIDVTDQGYNNNDKQDDVLPRMLYASGERISLQTCINETVNRCVLAR